MKRALDQIKTYLVPFLPTRFDYWWRIIIVSVFIVFLLLYYSLSHYDGVIMTTMAAQTTSLMVVYSTVYSDANQRKHQSSASLAFVWGIHRTGEFPAQRASYAENVSIWWRHHVQWLWVWLSNYIPPKITAMITYPGPKPITRIGLANIMSGYTFNHLNTASW